jgi:hypothetical protein
VCLPLTQPDLSSIKSSGEKKKKRKKRTAKKRRKGGGLSRNTLCWSVRNKSASHRKAVGEKEATVSVVKVFLIRVLERGTGQHPEWKTAAFATSP